MHTISAEIKAAHDSTPPPLDRRVHALFLDLDGTLVDIQHHHADVAAEEELLAVLRRLPRAFGGAVALITGRTIADADRVLAGSIPNVAGIHGLQHRIGGVLERDARATAEIIAALADVTRLVNDGRLHAHVEVKGASIALHYRHAPATGHAVRAAAAEIAARRGLRTIPGKMVIEIVAGAHTKGDAVEAYMREPQFAQRIPVAIGDDITDEDAFAAAAAAGGFAILVGERRPSAADYWLETPRDVLSWLQASLEGAP